MAFLSEESRVTLMIMYSLIIVFGMSGNSCVLFALISSKENRKKIQNVYLLSLSIADILFCLVFSPYTLLSLIDPKLTVQLEAFCKIKTFLTYTLSIAGLTAITALSLDRYFAIRYPFAYQEKVNTRMIFLFNLLVYLYPVALFLPLLVGKEWTKCFAVAGVPHGINWRGIPMAYVYFIGLLVIIVPGVILIFTNIYVFIVARKQYLKSQKHDNQGLNFQTVGLNKVLRIHSIRKDSCPNQASNVSHKNRSDKCKTNKFKHQPSFEKVPFSQSNETVDTPQQSPCALSRKPFLENTTDGTDTDLRVKCCKKLSETADFKATDYEDKYDYENKDHSIGSNAAIVDHTNAKSVDVKNQTFREVRNEDVERLENQLKQQKVQHDWKVAIMTIALVIGFFITWLPFIVSRFTAFFNNGDPSSDIDYYAAAFTTVNSVINPYLVLATRQDVRQVVLKKIRSCKVC